MTNGWRETDARYEGMETSHRRSPVLLYLAPSPSSLKQPRGPSHLHGKSPAVYVLSNAGCLRPDLTEALEAAFENT